MRCDIIIVHATISLRRSMHGGNDPPMRSWVQIKSCLEFFLLFFLPLFIPSVSSSFSLFLLVFSFFLHTGSATSMLEHYPSVTCNCHNYDCFVHLQVLLLTGVTLIDKLSYS